MVDSAFLMDADSLARALAGESRSERMEQRVKPTMKRAIEFAAMLSGTDTSEFMSTVAFQAALDRIGTLHRMRLEEEDAARFLRVLDERPGPNAAMRDLMAGYDPAMDEAAADGDAD